VKADHERRNLGNVLLDFIARSCREERTVYVYAYEYVYGEEGNPNNSFQRRAERRAAETRRWRTSLPSTVENNREYRIEKAGGSGNAANSFAESPVCRILITHCLLYSVFCILYLVAASADGSAQRSPLLAVDGLTVRYGPTEALSAVSLDVFAGEVHAVVGENGAGKSTLLRAIAGTVEAAGGGISRHGRVAWVAQETELPPDLTALDWIFLGRERRGRMGLLKRAEMRRCAAEALRRIGCRAAVGRPLRDLSAPERKQVQLARGFDEDREALLLDEPTAVLGDAETQQLFRQVREQKRRGTGILYVSHRLEEVLAIADRVTVLRDGRHVSTDLVAAVNTVALVKRMVGRDLPPPPQRKGAVGNVLLRVSDLDVAHVCGVSFSARSGEVVGLAGLVGAGRSEVLEAIAGLRRARGGRIELAARPRLVPEDRAAKGLIPTMSLRENLFLPAADRVLDPRGEKQKAAEWIERLAIRAPGSEVPIDRLSGGNQQKLLLARALRHRPRLLLLDEPTAGVDVGAKAEIHQLIRELAAAGAAVVVASSELPELLALCDRVIGLYMGRKAGEIAIADATEERLAAMIMGVGIPPLKKPVLSFAEGGD
jgi:rhamnose transport system ATP-binding protein